MGAGSFEFRSLDPPLSIIEDIGNQGAPRRKVHGNLREPDQRPRFLLPESRVLPGEGLLGFFLFPPSFVDEPPVDTRILVVDSPCRQVRQARSRGGQLLRQAGGLRILGPQDRPVPFRHLVQDQRARADQVIPHASPCVGPEALGRQGESQIEAPCPYGRVAQRASLGKDARRQSHVLPAELLRLEGQIQRRSPLPQPQGEGRNTAQAPGHVGMIGAERVPADVEGARAKFHRCGGVS